jgi:hypothetical protein
VVPGDLNLDPNNRFRLVRMMKRPWFAATTEIHSGSIIKNRRIFRQCVDMCIGSSLVLTYVWGFDDGTFQSSPSLLAASLLL